MVLFIAGCYNQNLNNKNASPCQDTVVPTIKLNGSSVDTTYLHTPLNDKGVGVFNDRDGIVDCSDFTLITKYTGQINTHIPGTYHLHYNAMDSSGNPLTAVTRTVHVVENSANVLSGNYYVTCTCTASSAGSANFTIATENYTSTVMPGAANKEFELITLNVGDAKVVPYTSLNGSSINVGNFGLRDYHSSSSGTGTLSAAKNTFTIESIVYPFSGSVIYRCKNIFTKALIHIKIREEDLVTHRLP
ncbi:MAG: peptidase [Bacteroidetes bacterium]|nr:peptidase [Bacteroidota bacterium]